MRFTVFTLLCLLFTSRAFSQAGELARLLTSTESDNVCEENIQQQCVRELCGQALETPNYQVPSQALVVPERSQVPAALRERLTGLVDQQLEENRRMLQHFKNGDTSAIEFDSELTWETNARTQYGTSYQLEIDNSLPKAERIKVTLTPPAGASAKFLAGLQSYVDKFVENIKNDSTVGMEQGFLTPEEGSAVLQERWRALQEKMRTRRLPRSDASRAINRRIEFLEVGLRSPDLARNIREVEGIIAQYDRLARGEPEGFYYVEAPPHCQDACREGIREQFLGNLGGKIAHLETLLNEPTAREELLENCQQGLELLYNANKGAEYLNERLPIETDLVINKGMSGASDHSKEAFKRYVQERMRYSFGTFNYEERMSNDERSFSNLENAVQRLNKIDRTSSLNTNLTICQSRQAFASNSAGDHIRQGVNNGPALMELSQFSCTHHDIGSQVIAHELSHVLSLAMKQNALSRNSHRAFMELRSCVNAQNPSTEGPLTPLKFRGDNRFTEEDTADIIGFKASIGRPLYHCALMPRSLDYTQYSAEMGLTAEPNDSHSSQLTRLIKEAFYKNMSLPASCQAIVDQNQPQLRLQRCQ